MDLSGLNLYFAPATILLVVLSTGLSLYAFFIDSRLYEMLTLHPYRMLERKSFHTLLTSGFLHGDIQHLIVNNAVLLLFGTSLEFILGAQVFLFTVIVVIVIINLYIFLAHRKDISFFNLGLGGAVIWTILCVLLLSPSGQLPVLLTAWAVPSLLFATGYFIYIYYVISKKRDNVHHRSVLGGIVLAFAFILIYLPDIFHKYLDRIFGN